MTYTQTQTVRFRHCDPARIVFYPRYFEMINDLFEDWFASLDWDFHMLHEERHEGVPTLETTAKFLRPCRLGDELELQLEVTKIGASSFELAFTAHCAGELRWSAASKLVYVRNDGTSIHSIRIPPELRERMLRDLRAEEPATQ